MTTDPAAPNSCLRSLIQHGRVRHVVNLYAGKFPLHDSIAVERRVTEKLGATHHDSAGTGEGEWCGTIRSPADYARNRGGAMRHVAALIREQVLAPEGRPPAGNVYFHCGGGMHRSGMLFGILRRFINKDPMDLIEREYKRHTAWKSPSSPGGFEALNLRSIREFDCSLLEQP